MAVTPASPAAPRPTPARPEPDPDAVEVGPFDQRFDVPVRAGGGLAAAAAALSRKLAGLPVPTHRGAVFLSVVGRPRLYTQCLVDPELGAWVECVSNQFLEGTDRLSAGQERTLLDLGYEPPDEDSPNFGVEYGTPVPWDVVAHLLLAPFATVFPCHDAERLELVVKPWFTPLEDAGADRDPAGDRW